LSALGLQKSSRLLAVIIAAVLAVLVILGVRANALWGASRAAEASERLAGLTVQATTLIHELQQERDHSVGYVSSGRKVGEDLVALQYVDVDNAIKDYRAARDQVEAPSESVIQDRLDAADAQLVKLDQVRAQAQDGKKPVPAQISAEYDTTIGSLISILPAVADGNSDVDLVACARSLSALAEAKESVSAQRGFLFGILTVNQFAKGQPAQLTAQQGKVQAALDHLFNSLDKEHRATYESTVDNQVVQQSDKIVADVLTAPGGKEFGVGAGQWFDTVSARIDLMREAEALFTADLIDDAGGVSSAARWRLILEGFLLVLVLVGTLGLALLLALSVSRGGGAESAATQAATRRRILALAGQQPSGSGERPVDIKDLVRTATGEIEDQARVVQGTMAPRAVTASVASDLAHIVSELLDNAASFSDPESRVFVKAKSAVDGGAVIEVEDQGRGMSPAELAAANALLAGNVDEGSAGRGLGLCVVGQLAARHGISVQLKASDDGEGTTAVVRLPAAVVVLSTASRGDSAGTRETPAIREPAGRTSVGSAALRESPGARESALPRREPGASRPDLSPFGSAAATGEMSKVWDFASKPPEVPWNTAPQPAARPVTSSPTGRGDAATSATSITSWSGSGASGGLLGAAAGESAGASGDDAVLSRDATPPPANRGADSDPEATQQWSVDLFSASTFADDLGGDPDSGGSGVGRRLPSERYDMPGPADVTLPDISRIVPPITEPEVTDPDVRLSIYDAIESEWFRQRAVGDYERDVLSDSWEQPAIHWDSPADEGWRAAQRLREAPEPPRTSAGLPQRTPMANFVPGSITTTETPAQRPTHPRSAEMVREMLSTYHRGVREGRHAKHRR
jgi:anti-sigma regulatory factor (Ser/Thr protein kinase)